MRPFSSLIIFLFAIPVFFGCKKDSAKKPGTCRIVATYDTIWSAQGTQTSSTRLTYDNDGRIAYAQINWPTETVTRVYTYRDSMIVITPTSDRMSIDTVWLNGKQQAVKLTVTFPGVSTYTQIFSYDAAGLLQSTVGWNDPNQKTTVTYTYANGDCTSSTSSDGYTTKYTYYTDKSFRDGDAASFSDYFNYGVILRKNDHLSKTAQYDQALWLYSYSFDNEGKITSTTERSGGQVNKSSYEYDCSQ